MYYILNYKFTEGYMEKRAPYRDRHLKYATDSLKRGELFMGGALADPADSALIIFKGDSPEAAEQFARNDIYVKEGVVESWTVRPWTVVIGGQA